MDLRGTRPMSHVGLQVNETCVDLVSQQHALCSAEIGLGNQIFIVIVNSSFELADCLAVSSCFSEDQPG